MLYNKGYVLRYWARIKEGHLLATLLTNVQNKLWKQQHLQNCFLSFSDEAHETPLHMCVQRNDIKFTKMLVKANADLNIRDKSGNRPIDIKIENEDVTNILQAAMFEKDRLKKTF